MSRIFLPGKICVSVQDKISVWKRTSLEISMACFRRDRIFNNVINRSVLLHASPKSGVKGQSFFKRSYSCDVSIFVLTAFDV